MPSPRYQTFSASMMEENVIYAQQIITKWDLDSSSYTKIDYLFTGDRQQAREFVKAVKALQTAMHFFVSEKSSSDILIRAQNLMQMAMKRLEKEFYQILSTKRDSLNPESVSSRSSSRPRSSVSDYDDGSSEEEDLSFASSPSETERASEMAMADLKAIADCMISSGYGKECVKIYKIIRRSIVDKTLYYLRVEKFTFSQVSKMDWEVLEPKIKSWLSAVKVAVKTLFNGERLLCDHVFSASEKIRDSVFSEIAKDGALTLFVFPELVSKCKKSPEKMFRILDLYDAISEMWPETESIFSSELTSAVRSQAVASFVKLGEAVRTMLSDFEAAIQKDVSKSPIIGGCVHPLTRYVMNYLVFLSDYSGALSDIVADWPLSVQTPFPESYYSSPLADETSAVSERFAWLVLVLLCKLDGKAELYKEVSLSYLFLANNLSYVVSKVRSSNLKIILGEEWLTKHETKVKQYAGNYERMAWSKAILALPENPMADISLEAAKECFKRFNLGFEEAFRKQTSWVVPDPKLRNDIKISVAKKLTPAYRTFYEKYRGMLRGLDSVVKFAPDDVSNYLSDMFNGTGVLGSTSSYSSAASSPSRSR